MFNIRFIDLFVVLGYPEEKENWELGDANHKTPLTLVGHHFGKHP